MDVPKNPCIITSTDANDTTLSWSAFKGKGEKTTGEFLAIITVISGTFKFSAGSTADSASCPSYTSANTVPPITFSEANPLHFKAANASEVFNIAV